MCGGSVWMCVCLCVVWYRQYVTWLCVVGVCRCVWVCVGSGIGSTLPGYVWWECVEVCVFVCGLVYLLNIDINLIKIFAVFLKTRYFRRQIRAIYHDICPIHVYLPGIGRPRANFW